MSSHDARFPKCGAALFGMPEESSPLKAPDQFRVLEEQNDSLQQLVCYLLRKNETLRAELRQLQNIAGSI